MAPIEINKRALGGRLRLSSSQKHVLRLPGIMDAHVLEFDDAHFHEGSAVLMPDPEPQGDGATGRNDRVTGIALLAACYRHAEQHADQTVLIMGHALKEESDPSALAQRRAENVRALLKGDRGSWVDTVDAQHIVEDYQQVLKWLAVSKNWDCDPGPIDNILGPQTRSGIKGFQRTYNQAFGASIVVDGIVGPQTWGAVFDVYMRSLQGVLQTDPEGVQAYRRMVHFIDAEAHAVGCGAAHPIPSKWTSDYRSQTDRRVEAFFFDSGNEPRIGRPLHDPDTPPQIDVFDPLWYQFLFIPHSASAVTVSAKVQIAEVEGLYQPGHDDGHDKRAGYKSGYKSEDDEGRIFINHKPLTSASDWQDAWAEDTQYIELTAEIDVTPDAWPADARIVWTWEDPDDPSNEAMHSDAGQYVDPLDYDHAGYAGATADDNRGQCDHPLPGGGDEAAFEEISPYVMKEAGARTCETHVVKNESKVRLHCTNVGGDNVRVRVRIKPHPALNVTGDDATGVMTMWKRIDVEYREMKSANKLPIDKVPPYFEPARVQMDFVDGGEVPDRPTFGDSSSEIHEMAENYVKRPPKGAFTNEEKPGWFFLAAAMRAGDPITKEVVHDPGDDSARIEAYQKRSGEWAEKLIFRKRKKYRGPKGAFPRGPYFVTLHQGGNAVELICGAHRDDTPTPAHCTLYPWPLDYQPDFQPADGSLDAAYARRVKYYPRHTWFDLPHAWEDGGLGFPDAPVDITVEALGSWSAIAGISPMASRGSGEYFAGRTIVFTHHRTYSKGTPAEQERSMLTTIVHEFGHAFGFPHKCGYYTHEAPAKKSCCMNYFNTWLFELDTGTSYTVQPGDTLAGIARRHGIRHWSLIYEHPRNAAFRARRPSPGQIEVGDLLWIPEPRQLQSFETGQEGVHFCGRHLDGIRRVHLEDNPALWDI